MRLLLLFKEHSKVRMVQDLTDLDSLIQQTYDLAPKSYYLQIYDKDFDEFIDLEDATSVQDKDKIKIQLLQPSSPVEAFCPENSLSLSTSSIVDEDVNIVVQPEDVSIVVQPAHQLQWPHEVMLPFKDFSGPLQEALSSQKNLSWDHSREIIGHLANYAYSFKPYPSKRERLQICEALVQRYPYLRNDVGAGVGGWELKLLNKMKKLRQSDESLEVKLNRIHSRVAFQKTPKKIYINPRKGELNWAPDHIPGETAESLNLHKKFLHEESLKSQNFQDKEKVASLMSLTYSFRREKINNKISVRDLKDEYPIFFQMTDQFDEFERLTAVSMSNFFDESVEQGPILYNMFSKKKKTIFENNLLESFNERYKDMDTIKRQQSKIAFGVFVLPYLLKEKDDCIFKFVSYLIIKFFFSSVIILCYIKQ